MALLHHVEHFPALSDRRGVRLNWRLILAVGGTACFWVAVAQGVARLV